MASNSRITIVPIRVRLLAPVRRFKSTTRSISPARAGRTLLPM